MKTRRYTYLCLTLLCSVTWVHAQSLLNKDPLGYYNTVLDVSQTVTTGSARIQAIGGAQVALGGDLSIVLVNPASLGFFRAPVVQVTPSFALRETETNFFNNKQNTSQARLSLAGVGGVWVEEGREELGFALRRSVFALSFQQINTFNQDFSYEGQNTESSILDSFTESDHVQGKTPSQIEDPFLAAVYDQYLIGSTTADPRTYTSVAGDQSPFQDERYRSGRSQHQVTFGYGASYKDKLYFGGSLGWVLTRYKRDREYTERFSETLNSFTNTDHLSIRGSGLNATLGAVYTPIHLFRFGASVQTPSVLWLRENSHFDLVSTYDNHTVQNDDGEDVTLRTLETNSDRFESSYRIFTPWRFHAGAAVFFQTRAFISVSATYVDYTQGRIESDDFSASADNAHIEDNFESTLDYRVGGELRFPPIRLRAGYAYLGAPSDDHKAGKSISGGIGVLFDRYFVDITARSGVAKSANESYVPYELQSRRSPQASLTPSATQWWLTFGARF